jgi:hypothetical protein
MTTLAPYLTALSAMMFSALSALTLILSIRRFDPPEAEPRADHERTAA